MDAVLLMGILCQLTRFDDRLTVLRRARRVLRPQGVLVAGALSRWARALVHAATGQLADPTSHQHTLAAMRDGQLPDRQRGNLYLHDPQELSIEVRAAGFRDVDVIGVEGPAGPWAHQVPLLNQHAIELARASDTALPGASTHMLATACNPS